MAIEESGAQAVAKKFADLQHLAQSEGELVLVDNWKLLIRMSLEGLDEEKGMTYVTYRVTTFCPKLVHPVVDYAIGWGNSLEEANDMASEVYMSSVFPVIHAICCTCQSGYGVENRILYVQDSNSGVVSDWRLIQSPPVMINADEEVIHRDTLTNMLDSHLPELIKQPGSYWFKCYVGKSSDTVDADCFLNNVEFELGKQRFLGYAQTLNSEKGFVSFKQHALIYPSDEAVVKEYRSRSRNELATSLKKLSGVDQTSIKYVLAGLEAFRDLAGFPEHVLQKHLIQTNIPSETAWQLTSFLPAACARERWTREGVNFGDEYVLFNFDSRKSERKSLSAEPLYLVCQAAVKRLREDELVGDLLDAICDFSAENNCIESALAEGAEPKDFEFKWLIVPTDKVLDGRVDKEIVKALGLSQKPWWKFW